MRTIALALVSAITLIACGEDPQVFVDAAVDANRADATDLAAPDTTITMAPGPIVNVANARLEFTASEPGTFRCRLDGGAAVDCTSPRSLTGLTDGAHTFEVAAVDSSGNQDPTPALHTWRVDTVAPDTQIVDAPPPIDNSVDVEITFRSPGEAEVTFECALDGASFAACTVPYRAMALTDGSHNFRVRAKDAAGNLDPTPAAHTWQIDTVSPDTQIDSGPAGTVASRNPSFTFSSPGAGPGATFACRLDGAAFAACTSPRAFVGLADGAHTFDVRVTDALGNSDPTPARRAWTIDATGPVTTLLMRPDNPTADTTPTFTFSADEPATFECQIDGQAPYAPCASPFNGPSVPGGARFFRVRATDVIGNRGPEATYEWVIDAAGPSLLITTGPSGAVASTTALINWNSSEPARFCYRFAGDVADTCTPALAGSGTVTRDGLAQGPQTFTVTGTDALGNVGPAASRNFTVDTVGPAVAITAGPQGTVGASSNGFTFTSPEAATYCYTVDTQSEQCSTSAAPSTSVTINSLDGAHTLTVVARDPLGNRTVPPVSRAWTVDTRRPTVTIAAGPVPGSTLGVGDATVELTTLEAATTCWRINGGAETCSAAGVMAATAMPSGLADGAVVFTARASDAIGFGPTVTRTWTVDTVRPTATITAGPAEGATVGSAEATFTVQASESARICWQFGADPVTCTATDVITFSPSQGGLSQGASTFTAFARDAIGDGPSVSRSWIVDTIRPSITITAGPAQNSTTAVNVGSFTVLASEPATICWRFGGGAETCSAAGAINAAPMSGALADGGALFEVYGRDLVATGPTSSRSWTIDTTRPTITIAAGPAAGSTVGSSAASLNLVASEPSTICWRFNGGAQTCTAPGQSNAVAAAANLPDGATAFTATGADAVGVGVAAARAWTIDTVRPVVAITAGPSEGQRLDATAATFTVTSSEAATICWQLDGGAPTCSPAGVLTTDIALAGLAQGERSLAITVRDQVGVGAAVTRSFVVDTIRPTVAIASGPAPGATVSASQVNFTVTSSEPSTICWRFDGGGEVCGPADQLFAAPSAVGLAEGGHSVEIYGRDAIGVGPSVVRAWTVDTVRPTVTIDVGPAQGSISGTNFPTFVVSASEPSTICWRFNDGAQSCSAPGQVMVTIDAGPLVALPAPARPVGTTFAVEASDGFGPGPRAVRSWSIDLVRPVVTITAGPAQGSLLDNTTATFELAATEPSRICWSFNGGAEQCSAPGVVAATAVANNLPQGANGLSFVGEDGVGRGAIGNRGWTVDSVAPVITISTPPGEGEMTAVTAASFTITTDEPATICWSLDGGAETCSAPLAVAIDAALMNLPSGPHQLFVRASDPVPNEATAARNWTVTANNGPPTEFVTTPPADWPLPFFDFSFRLTGGGANDTIQCSLDAEPFTDCGTQGNPVGQVNSKRFAYTLAEQHTLRIRGVAAGNGAIGPVETHTFSVSGGLIMYYPFEQRTGAENRAPGVLGLFDGAPVNPPLAMVGARHGAGIEAEAITVPGSSQAMVEGPAYVFSAWLRDPGNGDGTILDFSSAQSGCALTGAGQFVELTCKADGVALAPLLGSLGSMLASDQAWHNVTVVVFGPAASLWVDGSPVDSISSPGPSIVGPAASPVGPVRLGGSYALDEVQIYNRTLSSEALCDLAHGRWAANTCEGAALWPVLELPLDDGADETTASVVSALADFETYDPTEFGHAGTSDGAALALVEGLTQVVGHGDVTISFWMRDNIVAGGNVFDFRCEPQFASAIGVCAAGGFEASTDTEGGPLHTVWSQGLLEDELVSTPDAGIWHSVVIEHATVQAGSGAASTAVRIYIDGEFEQEQTFNPALEPSIMESFDDLLTVSGGWVDVDEFKIFNTLLGARDRCLMAMGGLWDANQQVCDLPMSLPPQLRPGGLPGRPPALVPDTCPAAGA